MNNISREKILNEMTQINKPLAKVFDFDGTLGSYVAKLVKTSDLLVSGIDKEKSNKLIQIINDTFIKYGIEKNISNISPIINTGDHFGVLSSKDSFYSQKIYSKYLEMVGDDKILALAWENISMNNPTFPRGIIVNNQSRIALISDKYSSFTFSNHELELKDKDILISEINNSFLSEEIKIGIIKILSNHNSKDCFAVIIKINNFLWDKMYGKNLFMLPLVQIISKYINQNLSLFEDMFLKDKELVKRTFTNNIGGFFIDKNKVKGTSIGYFFEKNSKGNNITKIPILIDDSGYYYIKGDNKIQLSDSIIIEYLKSGKLQISLSVAYILLMDIGLLPIGGTSQIQYMETFIKFYEEVSGKNMEIQKDGLLTFGGFTFGEFSLESESKTPSDYVKHYSKKVYDLLDADFFNMAYLKL